MAKLRFAIIGCGRMGRRRARAVAQNKNGEVVSVTDNDVSHAKSLAEELNCEFHTSCEEAFRSNDIDAVVVSVPNKFHPEVSLKSLQSGKHVFCEKPLAITPKEAKLMVLAAMKEKVFLKAGSNVRFFDNVEKAKRLVDNGDLGKILFARGWIGHQGWNLKPGSWFVDSDLIGKGTMLDNGCHIVDLIRWFMCEIKECFGYSSTLFHKLPKNLEDNAMGILIGLNGEPVFIQSSWTEWNEYLYLEFYGTNGALYINNRGNESKTVLKTKDNGTEIFDYSKKPKISFQREIEEFILSVLSEKQPLPSGYDGMRAVQVIDGIYRSSKESRKVSVYGTQEKELLRRLTETYGQSFR